MKFYLHLIFFFFFLAGSTCSSFAQEQTTNEASSSLPPVDLTDSLGHEGNEREHPIYGDHPDIPDVLIHRVEHESDTFQSKFLNMLFILALLIGFMMLASWALKRLMRTKVSQLNTSSNIKILETRYLSPRATLYLVEIQDRAILIAESPTSVTFLTSIPQEDPHSSSLPSHN